jgi:isopenicillin N synthase-like dioxygenase
MEAMATDLAALKGQDFVRVPYPQELAQLVRETERLWREFCSLPREMKLAFGYQPDAEKSGVGYQPPESGRDPKEHVHVRLAERAWLRTQAKRLGNPVVTRFIESALALARAMQPFAQHEFLETAERDFHMPGLTSDAMNSAELWTLRFLNYLGGTALGEPIAAEHVDKGAFTAHLFESDSGFERYTQAGAWEPVEFGDGETMIIAGLGLQFRSRCLLKAMHHRVVANERTRSEGRTSIVCFFDFRGQVYYDKARYGPTQQFGAGHFYRMPFARFVEFFAL